MVKRVIGALALLLSVLPVGADPGGRVFYVAPNGSDAWSGALAAPNKTLRDGPFATLEHARDAVRALKQNGSLPQGGVTVMVRGGVYELSRPLALEASDSGTAEAPITYRAYPGEQARLVGGRVVTGWQSVTDSSVLQRLDPAARGKVMQADLRAQGITDFGELTTRGFGRPVYPAALELFFQDRPMTLARWPNADFTRIAAVPAGPNGGQFAYEGDRPARWLAEDDVWVHGYWTQDWADSYEKVARIDPAQHLIYTRPPHGVYGYKAGQRFYALNALTELDSPGEWYLDRKSGILYFWPPASLTRGRAMVSVLPTLVTLQNTDYVTLQGFTLEAARGTAVTVNAGTHNRVAGCTLRNIGNCAVSINGGKENGVVGCDIYETGDGGISLNGGDRKTLTPAGNYADNNHIYDYSRWDRTYRPAIGVNGVGNRVTHNLLHDGPHNAIQLSGNDHLIAFNEIHNVCYETGDVGAFYMGRDWTMRGTVIRNNYFHHITGPGNIGAMGVYLDDMSSGIAITGNVFYQVTRAAFIGGGRDNLVENNVFVECNPSVHVDARALGWAKDGMTGIMHERLLAMPYQQSPWRDRYPKLVGILEDEPGVPKGNVVARNICWGGRWEDIETIAKPHVAFTDNLVQVDPLFVNAKKGNFQLRPESPAFKLGFQRIPVEEIGLYKDALRASWPVKHPVRKMPAPQAAAKHAGPTPVCRAARPAQAIQIDGMLSPGEWGDATAALRLQQDESGGKTGPESLAWVASDREALYVAVQSRVDSSQPLRLGGKWGQDDAVEVALSAGKNAPIFVLRGYPNGSCESSVEAGAPEDAARKAGTAMRFAAQVDSPTRWTAEYRIPYAALGINPAKQKRLEFNLTVRKTASSLWLMWKGTNGHSWDVDRAGVIILPR